MTIKEAIDLALSEMPLELAATSMPTWRCHAKKAMSYWGGQKDLTTLTRLEVQQWVNARSKQVKPSTVDHERCFLSRLWRVLEDRGLDVGLQCPLLRLRMPKMNKSKRKITEGVLLRLKQDLAERDWELIDFTLLTLLRRLEVFRLEPEHITLFAETNAQGRAITLGKARIVTSKTGRGRTVPLNEEAASIVKARIKKAKEQGHRWLFGDQRQDRYAAGVSWTKRCWSPLVSSYGEGGTFHGLRHYGAHTAWKNGAPIAAISKMLGHSSIVQTEHYIGVNEEYSRLAADATTSHLSKQPEHKTPTEISPSQLDRKLRHNDWIFSM